jgi:3-deoxy-7-phosphoheptulonate synthase
MTSPAVSLIGPVRPGSSLAAAGRQIRLLPAEQQPQWRHHPDLPRISSALAAAPALIGPAEIDGLRGLLAEAAAGRLQILQAGDCAEDPTQNSSQCLSRKLGLVEALAAVMRVSTGLPVLTVGRIAGQFAKPRSRDSEQAGGVTLPVYRGPMINRPDPDLVARRHDPSLMLTCHAAAAATVRYLSRTEAGRTAPLLWTSHEALVLDYELPQLRRGEGAGLILTSAHWPWIGLRTCQPAYAHVAMLAAVSNPVACKVGPGTTAAEVVDVCARLDPLREPGRLTLIARMGAAAVTERLPALVTAVRRAAHPVIWLCDPMHANTTTTDGGRKTRLVSALVSEVRGFQQAVRGAGGTAGGLHLEVTPDPVTECVSSAAELPALGERYTTLCDPRLNPRQAIEVAAAWLPPGPDGRDRGELHGRPPGGHRRA